MSFPPPGKHQARIVWLALTTLAVAVMLAFVGGILWALGWVLHRLSAVLVPLAFALILAYILDPVAAYFERKKMSRLWAVCFVFTLGVVLFSAVLGSVLPDLRRESRKLVEDLPKNVDAIRSKADYFLQESPLARQLRQSLRMASGQPLVNSRNPMPPPKRAKAPPVATNSPNTNGVEISLNLTLADPTNDPNATQTNAINISASTQQLKTALDTPLSQTVLPGLTRALVFVAKWFTTQLSNLTTWVEFLIGFVLVPVYLFYFLLEKESITRSWHDYLPMKESTVKNETVFVLRSINDCMIVFFRGQVLVALCVGVLLAAGYMLLGLNYAILLGIVAAVLGIVPYLGTITSLLLALAVAAIQFEDWTHPLCVVGIAAVVKLLEDFIISPKIIGERSGLHPLTIILAVLIGTTLLGGFIGALLAIPLTAALRTLMFRYVWTREHPRSKPPASKKIKELVS